eukprot:5629326-Heterocapsa_arctica.AAC.1
MSALPSRASGGRARAAAEKCAARRAAVGCRGAPRQAHGGAITRARGRSAAATSEPGRVAAGSTRRPQA